MSLGLILLREKSAGSMKESKSLATSPVLVYIHGVEELTAAIDIIMQNQRFISLLLSSCAVTSAICKMLRVVMSKMVQLRLSSLGEQLQSSWAV